MPTKRIAQLLHLDADRAELLNALAAETRIAKSVLMREAIEDLLLKYEKLKRPKARTAKD